MPDRPSDRARSGGPEEEPEFTWLYDTDAGDARADATRAGPQQRRRQPAPRPDETRMIRTQPRDQPRDQQRPAARNGSRTRPAPPPVAPPPGPRRTRRRLPRFRLRFIFLLVLAYVVYLVVVPFVAWNKVEQTAWQPQGERPADQPGTTYLLVGSDSRAGLSAAQRKELSTGDPAGQRTDTIMLLHTGAGPNLLMSVPRDSIVDIPGRGATKINAAFAYGGAPLLVQTIEQDTGIRIDDYVETGFGGVVDLVDAVGGIEICPNKRMVDKLAGLNVKKGCQQADGKTALAYSRSRHTNVRLGDVARARQQREVVKAVGKAALSPWTVLNPVRYWRLNMAVPEAFSFGEGTGKVRAAMWAMAMTRVGGSTGLTCSVPISDLRVTWDAKRSQQLFDKIIADDTESVGKDLCTPSGFPS